MNHIAELSAFKHISGATARNTPNGNDNNNNNDYGWVFGVGVAIAGLAFLYISTSNNPFNYEK